MASASFRRFASIALLLLATSARAQTPSQRYKAAQKQFEHHTSYGPFSHDGSPEALTSLESMWKAAEDDVTTFLTTNPTATAQQINARICILESTDGKCDDDRQAIRFVIQLGPQLFAVSVADGEIGTVFIVGPRDAKPAVLWSIRSVQPQAVDRHGILAAWQTTHASDTCREKTKVGAWDTCGPIYASLGLLPPDSEHRPRFYIAGGYAQVMGATIGTQMSIWRWDGDHATLLWIDSYDKMVGQRNDDQVSGDILNIAQKEDFRSFFSCGQCEGRQVVRRVRLTPTGIQDLGKHSLAPNLDLVDELFWRIAHGHSATDLAAPQIVRLLKPQIMKEKKESQKIEAGYFSTGMLGDSSVTPIPGGKRICFTSDDIGRFYFTLLRRPDGRYTFTHVLQPRGNYKDCPIHSPGIVESR